MGGTHRTASESTKIRVAAAGALTAGALLLAPIGAAIATPGLAHAEGAPGGGTGGTGGGGAPGGGGTPDTSGAGGTGGTTGAHKQVIRLPGLKIEIKNVRGDHKPPTLKIVPFPGLNRILHPPTTGGVNTCPSVDPTPGDGDPTGGPGDPAVCN